jgi:uncharacterized membrane protein
VREQWHPRTALRSVWKASDRGGGDGTDSNGFESEGRMTNPFQAFWLRPRLLAAIAVAGVVGLAVPLASVWTRTLVAWCIGVLVYTALVIQAVAGQSPADLRRESSRLDDSAPVISLFAASSAAASFGAVAMLVYGQQEHDLYRAAHIALATATILCAWLFVQLVFAVHYMHVFYGDTDVGERRGGLDFNGDDQPNFWDFFYFATTIGSTFQTSDTDIVAKHIRRIVTAHQIYAYFFSTGVLALAINMAGGLFQH